MEVATLFTSTSEVISLFDEFIYSYPKIVLEGKDADTAYFNDPETGKRQLYYHYKLNDVNYEFSYNYSEDDIAVLKRDLVGDQIYCFDLSFRSNDFLRMLLVDFVEYLKHTGKELTSDIIISHPDKGLLSCSALTSTLN